MNKLLRSIMVIFIVAASLVMTVVYKSFAAGPLVSKPGNKHNLSSLNTDVGVKYKASDSADNPRGQQICIFCHTPHNANVAGQAPLWNRKFSSVENFQRYSTSTLQIRKFENIPGAQYGLDAQPNGSSKLCLSCHDGVSRLGAIYNGPEITMASNNNVGDINVIEGAASFKPSTNKMKTGHHPVSFVYNDAVRGLIQAAKFPATVVFTLPTLTQVKLDKLSRMQCTTCHDAHQNMSNDTEYYGSPNQTRKIAPFWVYGVNGTAAADQQAVCTTCHPMTLLTPDFVPPWPTAP